MTLPSGIGTRKAVPLIFPFNIGRTSVVAISAPVEDGIILTAAALALRKSLCGPSTNLWVEV